MFTFTFTTKDQYLQQKKEWFIAYKAAIAAIRSRKTAYKDVQRGKLSYGEWVSKHPHSVYNDLDNLIKARADSRVEAQHQYLAHITA